MTVAPTPKDTLLREGSARLYRFRRPSDRPAESAVPLLLVPSLINRWYVLDLRPGASLAAAVAARVPTYCLDWGVPEDEDRYLSWESILKRLHHAVSRVRKDSGAERVALLGYCMGGTLAAIYAALEPERVAALVNLAGPIDFSKAGVLSHLVDPRWFDAGAIAEAGNVSAPQMQSGFAALQPMLSFQKMFGYADAAMHPEGREAFLALETWANDNTAFPGAAYETYIKELYQENRLVKGEHAVGGRRVELSRIRCPVLSIVASRDIICPPEAATALNSAARPAHQEVLTIRGGHVGAVVGQKAQAELYPKLGDWLVEHTRRLQVVRTGSADASM